jgi:pyruvate kinase
MYNRAMRFIRTKIVATLGPSSSDPAVIGRLVEAGADVFRINFSHGTDEQHQAMLDAVRRVEAESGQPLAVLADLCGPKIRVRPLEGGELTLANGDEILIQRRQVGPGAGHRISITLDELIDEVAPGQAILLDDGKLRLEVVEPRPPEEVLCRVVRGGVLKSGKGVNLPHTALSVEALTEKDRADVAWITAGRSFDYVALSFVRRAADVAQLRQLLREHGSSLPIVAKIEKPQALQEIDAIIDAVDVVMVARGDLGVEMDLPSVPVAQKKIARKCRVAGKPCIIATQMLESMTEAPSPTRAEVSDVANAVLDCADAVMLSGETAAGRYPVEAVATMNDVVAAIEAYHDATVSPAPVASAAAPTVAALASAVRELLGRLDIAAVAVFTTSGGTARVLSKNRLPRPIVALSPDPAALRRMQLYYGVDPLLARGTPEHTREVLDMASSYILETGLARSGDQIVVLSGRPMNTPGTTNTLVIHRLT